MPFADAPCRTVPSRSGLRATVHPPAARSAVLAAAALLLAPTDGPAAAPKDRRFALVDATHALAPAADSSTLVLAREQYVRKNPLPPERLFLDGGPLGWLPQRSVVVARAAPGLRRLSGIFDAPDLVVSCAAGATVLLRLRETIDENDVLRMRWILDDPDAAPELLRASGLPRAVPSARGLAELAKRASRHAATGPADTATASPDAILAFPEMWFEHPLDPLNLRRDFSILTGTMRIDGPTLSYVLEQKRGEVRVEIPVDSIEVVRYGGTRFVGASPWIDVVYRDGGGRWRASFADARSGNPEATYNRIFGALAARRRAAPGP
jgi:hypothetical protein